MLAAVIARPGPAPLRLELPRSPTAAAIARERLRKYAAGHLSAYALSNSLLAVTELVTNALRHGEGSIVLSLALERDHLRAEVIDEGTGNAPAVRATPGDATGGFGLRIVDELSLRWGAFEGTTHVWAELPRD